MVNANVGSIGTVENTMMEAIKQSISIAHQEIGTGNPDMVRVSRCLRLGSFLLSGLEDFRHGDSKAEEQSPEHPAPVAASKPEEDASMAEITARLRGTWVIRRGALINYSQNSGWSYNIPKGTFIKVIDTIKDFAPEGQCSFGDLITESGIKESHVYRVYVLLFRAGLMRQQKANICFINAQEAERLDPEAIWRHIPKE